MREVKEPESYIRLLPDTIIDKIAAGEVIQRMEAKNTFLQYLFLV